METLSIVIPTLDEEEAIGLVLDECQSVLEGMSFESEIIVVDGNSCDRTAEIARKKGARVITEKRRGKGTAIMTAFRRINSRYVVMLDGDFSYDPRDIPMMLVPLLNDEADCVLGRRNPAEGSMARLNNTGNRIISGLVQTLYNIPICDVCTGFWAMKKDVVDLLKNGDTGGFDLEASMLIRTFHEGYHVAEIPVGYRPRKGSPKLHPLRGGISIVAAVVRMLRDYNPLLLFGGISVLSFLVGLFLGINVITMFQKYGQIMIGRALLTVLFILTGVQSLFFGLLSDMILRRDTR
ncbi:MAG: glycosyltransferase [Theionarchaea archaeon]|nr:glycosyltransferase [Theionarchaea archaeon]MBU6999777.1 glycosyltransferase [Theionarchaea archaeon]MBU7020198.1 glycosyltransferase [Theionarchaea archaeon]MBU7033685.1 glycosyltransferase [Theionarchaea archaeon]MBU7040483.1 glycosyltransferase [Theionarchaea archaeon]